MNVLVTGSNGFIGKNIVHELSQNYQVIGAGRGNRNLSEATDYFRWDIGKEPYPDKLLAKKPEIIIHGASSLDKNDCSSELAATNCLGTHRVYQIAKEIQPQLVILLSSVPVVGLPNGIVTENTQLKPITIYHVTKVFQEMVFSQLGLSMPQIRIVNLRIPAPIGPGQSEQTIVPIFIRKALNNEDITILGKGTRKQNYVDVRDIARAVEGIIEHKKAHGIYNIAASVPVSNIDLAKLCIDLTGSRSKIVFSDKADMADGQVWDVDCTKLKNDTEYTPVYSLEKTICDMASFMRKN